MASSPSKHKTPQLFAAFPAGSQSGLIMRWGPQSDERLAIQFAESARRLTRSYSGQPVDDFILVPWIYLYRHAIELVLKVAILYAAGLRRANGDSDTSLASGAVAERLSKKHRHSIGALTHELEGHLAALELQGIPPETARILNLIAMVDPKGESFRYTGNLPDSVDHIDFYAMSEAVDKAYRITEASLAMLESYAESQEAWLEEVRAIESDMEADYRNDVGYYYD